LNSEAAPVTAATVHEGFCAHIVARMSDNLKILLVEDNREHLRLTKYILEQNQFSGKVFVVRDGQEAMDFLFHQGVYTDAESHPRPDLVLLDLNTPRLNGRELLRIVKTDDNLREIPVVILSSSDREEDIAYASQFGVASYISKADGFEALSTALSSVHHFARRQAI
jgi:CheY-like chemotaxis protein